MNRSPKKMDQRYLIALGIAVTLLLVVLAAATQRKSDSVTKAGPVDQATQQQVMEDIQNQDVPPVMDNGVDQGGVVSGSEERPEDLMQGGQGQDSNL